MRRFITVIVALLSLLLVANVVSAVATGHITSGSRRGAVEVRWATNHASFLVTLGTRLFLGGLFGAGAFTLHQMDAAERGSDGEEKQKKQPRA